LTARLLKGVFFIAILKGLLRGVVYWLAGVPFVVFFTILSMTFATLPMVGISFIRNIL
jgi:predicted PurR-regulated permease PerM